MGIEAETQKELLDIDKYTYGNIILKDFLDRYNGNMELV